MSLLFLIALLGPELPGLPPYESVQAFLSNLWQVSATVVTIAIVFVILVLETVQRTVHGSYVWRRFAQASGFSLVIALLITTVFAAGFGALLLLPEFDIVEWPRLMALVRL